MGLDMYAYVANRPNQDSEWWAGAELNEDKDYVNPKVEKPRELAYWRKHPNLHGWMEKLAERKKLKYESFNGVELELTWEDLEDLERAVTHSQLPGTRGFFFGDPSDEYYRDHDMTFIKNAKAEIFCGLRVFYNSSW